MCAYIVHQNVHFFSVKGRVIVQFFILRYGKIVLTVALVALKDNFPVKVMQPPAMNYVLPGKAFVLLWSYIVQKAVLVIQSRQLRNHANYVIICNCHV